MWRIRHHIGTASRRDVYLAVWGVAFELLGLSIFFQREPLWPLWGIILCASGAVSLTAGFVRWPRFQSAAFVAITSAAAMRGVWHFYEGLVDGFQLPRAVLWMAVAASQLVIAGWPMEAEQLNRAAQERPGPQEKPEL